MKVLRRGPRPHLETDSDGRFRFEDLPSTAKVDFTIGLPGFLTVKLEKVQPTAGPLVITLVQAASVSALVVDPAGNPVSNAKVSLFSILRSFRRQEAHTNVEGRATFQRLVAGEVVLTASAGAGTALPQRLKIAAGERAEVRLELQSKATSQRRNEPQSEATSQRQNVKNKRGRVTGRVIDNTGRPLTGVIVRLRAVAPGNLAFDSPGKTTVEGRFELNAPAGSCLQGLAHLEGTGVALSEPFELAPGEVRDFELILGPGGTLTGRMLGFTGPDALQWFQVSAECGMGQETYTGYGLNGTYRIENLPPGKCRISAFLDALVYRHSERVVIGGHGETVELDLPLGVGSPLRGRIWIGEAPASDIYLKVLCLEDSSYSTSTASRHDGSFVFDRIPPSLCQLTVTHESSMTLLETPIDGRDLKAFASRPLIAIDPQTGTETRIELDP